MHHRNRLFRGMPVKLPGVNGEKPALFASAGLLSTSNGCYSGTQRLRGDIGPVTGMRGRLQETV